MIAVFYGHSLTDLISDYEILVQGDETVFCSYLIPVVRTGGSAAGSNGRGEITWSNLPMCLPAGIHIVENTTHKTGDKI
jgi:hypothetical protein